MSTQSHGGGTIKERHSIEYELQCLKMLMENDDRQWEKVKRFFKRRILADIEKSIRKQLGKYELHMNERDIHDTSLSIAFETLRDVRERFTTAEDDELHFRNAAKAYAYARTTAANLVRDLIKLQVGKNELKQTTETFTDIEAGDFDIESLQMILLLSEEDAEDPEKVTLRKIALDAIIEARITLGINPEHWDMFWLRVVKDTPISELAEKYDTSKFVISSTIYRVVTRIRKFLINKD